VRHDRAWADIGTEDAVNGLEEAGRQFEEEETPRGGAADDPASRTLRARDDSQVSLYWVASVALRRRKIILSAVGLGALIALGIGLLRPRTFTSVFSFVPQSNTDGGRSGLASLAGQFGVALGGLSGQGQSPQFYADLLSTREILVPVANDSVVTESSSGRPLPVWQFLHVRGDNSALVADNTFRLLRSDVVRASVSARLTGVVTVTVKTQSARASYEIAQKVLSGLNHFNVITRQSQAAAERRFAEGRLEASRASLRVAEDALQQFLQRNRQIVNSPELTLQRGRLERAVDVQQQLVTSLVQQYEDARIREVRDTPVITVIEHPAIPARSDARGLLTTVAAGGSIALLVALSMVLAVEAVQWRRADDPGASQLNDEWNRMRRRASL